MQQKMLWAITIFENCLTSAVKANFFPDVWIHCSLFIVNLLPFYCRRIWLLSFQIVTIGFTVAVATEVDNDVILEVRWGRLYDILQHSSFIVWKVCLKVQSTDHVVFKSETLCQSSQFKIHIFTELKDAHFEILKWTFKLVWNRILMVEHIPPHVSNIYVVSQIFLYVWK